MLREAQASQLPGPVSRPADAGGRQHSGDTSRLQLPYVASGLMVALGPRVGRATPPPSSFYDILHKRLKKPKNGFLGD